MKLKSRWSCKGHKFVYCNFFLSDESILLDLKHLLIEAKQKVPPFLAEYVSESEKYLDMGGTLFYCFNSIFYSDLYLHPSCFIDISVK